MSVGLLGAEPAVFVQGNGHAGGGVSPLILFKLH
jgi:hypothetical protein